MHPYTVPASIKDRVVSRQGKLTSHDTVAAARTALVVVDMQNYFVAEGFPLEVPNARGIVPNINRLDAACGGRYRCLGADDGGRRTRTLGQPSQAHANAGTVSDAARASRRKGGRFCALSEAGAAAD